LIKIKRALGRHLAHKHEVPRVKARYLPHVVRALYFALLNSPEFQLREKQEKFVLA
jgi:hypothetical protein